MNHLIADSTLLWLSIGWLGGFICALMSIRNGRPS